MEDRQIPIRNSITQSVHCSKCVKELAEQKIPLSPQQYAKVEFGFTKWGVQLWCSRHNRNIIHVDFGDQKLYANMSASWSTEPEVQECGSKHN